MSTVDLSEVRWRKSSFSGGTGGGNDNCVEVAYADRVAVRDSKSTGPVLVFPVTTWRSLVGTRQ